MARNGGQRQVSCRASIGSDQMAECVAPHPCTRRSATQLRVDFDAERHCLLTHHASSQPVRDVELSRPNGSPRLSPSPVQRVLADSVQILVPADAELRVRHNHALRRQTGIVLGTVDYALIRDGNRVWGALHLHEDQLAEATLQFMLEVSFLGEAGVHQILVARGSGPKLFAVEHLDQVVEGTPTITAIEVSVDVQDEVED